MTWNAVCSVTTHSTMMCHRAPTILAIVIACSTFGPALVSAQARDQTTRDQTAHDRAARDQAAHGAAADDQDDPELDGPGAADLARAIEIATMRSLQVLARARRLDDARAVRCLDPRVSELTSTFRQATERVARARRAERTNDPETVARETAMVRRLVEHARTLERTALECIGHEREVEADWTRTEVRRAPTEDDRRRAQRRYASQPR